MKYNAILKDARKVLDMEIEVIRNTKKYLDKQFVSAVNALYNCKGRIIVTGIGKSGLIARKIASTFASTGTPALFLHPTEGAHGELGVIIKDDVVIAVSNSGETEELLLLIPVIKKLGARLISITGNEKSTLANESDIVIKIDNKEACPLGLSPTASTTAMLAVGDALAIALLKKKKFKEKDFALIHPGGTIGKRLLIKVEDIMKKGDEIPKVKENATMEEIIFEITSKRMGSTLVVNNKGILAGIITDQDIRNELRKKDNNFFKKRAKDIMTKKPLVITKNKLVIDAIKLVQEKSVGSLPVIDKYRRPIGIIHLHDLLKTNL